MGEWGQVTGEVSYHMNHYAYPQAQEKLGELEHDHWVKIEGKCMKITPGGRPFARVAVACFNAYYKLRESQHARTI